MKFFKKKIKNILKKIITRDLDLNEDTVKKVNCIDKEKNDDISTSITKKKKTKKGKKIPQKSSRDTKAILNKTKINSVDVSFKDDIYTMEHPFFTLSRSKDLRSIKYEHNGNTVEVNPNIVGMPTVFDKDVLIYLYTQAKKEINRGNNSVRTIRVIASDLLKAIGKNTGGKDYLWLKGALSRLKGVSIKTNIKTNDIGITKSFGLIDSYEIIEKSKDNKTMAAVEVTFSEWLFNALSGNELITISIDYFNMRKPLERRLYELARKHCGHQSKWIVSVELLHKKTGSEAPLRLFKQKISKMEKVQKMPDYYFAYMAAKDQVIFHPKPNLQNLSKRTLLRPIINPNTYENIKKMFIKYNHKADVYAYEQEWLQWMEGKKPPKNPSAALYNFCKKKATQF